MAAATPKWVNRPNFFMSLRLKISATGGRSSPKGLSGLARAAEGSNPRTSPAICAGQSVASKRVIGPIPERPATNPDHVSAADKPTGVTAPNPVTTTRRSA